MAYIRSLFTFVLALSIAISSWALDKEVKALVHYETEANGASIRSPEAIQIEHFEIPYELVEKDIAEARIPKEVLQALTFQREGKTYIRWVINPEDSQWHKEVEKWLKSKKISAVKGKHFVGYQTASRSYIIEDPVTGFQFSCKVSTNKTGGAWRDKKQTYEDAWQIRMLTDYIVQEFANRPSKTLIILDEPAIFGLKELDQGMVIRSLGELPKSGKYYLPGFSALHEDVGRMIAERNGSKNPADFWNQHYNKPLARALAELLAVTGVAYDSPHSQNFLIELDEKLRPTGRIVLRDFGDTYLWSDFFEAKGRSDIPKRWELDNVMKREMMVSVGVLHGNRPPSWLTAEQYAEWGKVFFQEYFKAMTELAGVSRADLPTRVRISGPEFSYSNTVIDGSTAGWQEFFKSIKNKKAAPKGGGKCANMFKAS